MSVRVQAHAVLFFIVAAIGAAPGRADPEATPPPADAPAAASSQLGLPSDLPPPESLPESGRFAEVFFLRESDKILLPGKKALNASAKLLLEKPDVRIVIDGNADGQGEHLYNRCLSSWRALAVKRYLVARGVDESRITIKASSNDRPISSNETSMGRRQNRRVDLLVEDRAAAQLAAVQQ